MRLALVVGLLLVALVASAQASITGVLIVSPATTHDPSSLRLRATVHNGGNTPWAMPEVPLSIAQLSIDVRDAAGHRIGTIPPPVPRPGDDRHVPLAPGASRTFELSLNCFSPALPPGTYTLDWGEREGVIATPATFVVTP